MKRRRPVSTTEPRTSSFRLDPTYEWDKTAIRSRKEERPTEDAMWPEGDGGLPLGGPEPRILLR
jgi:hypothetical protein